MDPVFDDWRPPSDRLHLKGGVWESDVIAPVSYPDEGNQVCFQVEDESFWFAHRNACLLAVMRRFPAEGTFYDIGGGNGCVAAAVRQAGHPVVLLEPGPGAFNALQRGLQKVVHSTLDEAGFHDGSLSAVGAFDVLEHIQDDQAFLTTIRRLLHPDGRFYCTVPAGPALWSDEDVHAGHHRRHTAATLTHLLRRAGFTVEFVSGFFTWLVAPVFLFRSLPSRLGFYRKPVTEDVAAFRAAHRVPRPIARLVEMINRWELRRLSGGRPLSMGTSLIGVARPSANPVLPP
jgi:SAM-dependent methyltransferase